MVCVAHFIRFLRTLTQMALVCQTVPGERDKVRSTIVLTTYQPKYLHWKILRGSPENLTTTSSERKSRTMQVRGLVAQDEHTKKLNEKSWQSSDRQLAQQRIPASRSGEA